MEKEMTLEEINKNIEQIKLRLKRIDESKGKLGFSFAAAVTLGRIEEQERELRIELRKFERLKEQKEKEGQKTEEVKEEKEEQINETGAFGE